MALFTLFGLALIPASVIPSSIPKWISLAQQLSYPIQAQGQPAASSVEAWATSAAEEAGSVAGWDTASLSGGAGAPYQDYHSVRAESEMGDALADAAANVQYGYGGYEYDNSVSAPQTGENGQASFQNPEYDQPSVSQVEDVTQDQPPSDLATVGTYPGYDETAAGTAYGGAAQGYTGDLYPSTSSATVGDYRQPLMDLVPDPLMASNTSSYFEAMRAGESRSRSGSVHSQRCVWTVDAVGLTRRRTSDLQASKPGPRLYILTPPSFLSSTDRSVASSQVPVTNPFGLNAQQPRPNSPLGHARQPVR